MPHDRLPSPDAYGDRDLADEVDRKAYIEFTVAHLKRLLQGASSNMKDRCKSVANGGVLSTTAVGGMLLSLGRFAQEKKFSAIDFKVRLKALSTFDFANYTSGSTWGKLATRQRSLSAALLCSY